ncbi:MAG: c-type cytochrome [Gemmatimonadaceae bacterium]
MRRALRWLRNGLLGLVGLLVLLGAGIYVASELKIREKHNTAGRPVTVPSDAASIAEGERLARITGCLGCHGNNLEGEMFIDEPILARIAAPNLTVAASTYSDAELERIIRHGIRPDNRSVIAMPSAMFSALTDADMGRIIAYLRSVPPVEGQSRVMKAGPGGRVGMALGQYNPAVAEVRKAAEAATEFPAAGDSGYRGAYLARIACTECHGMDLKGRPGGTPDLAIAAGYTHEQFVRLMKTGVALGDRELELMSSVARGRFSNFTDDEITALHEFLVARTKNQASR